jgi:hypothetical protein
VLVRAGDDRAAAGILSAAIRDAEALRLPHQVQRIIRLTRLPGVLAGRPVRDQAQKALIQLDRQLANTDAASQAPRRDAR